MQTLSDEVLKLSVKYILLTSKIRCNGLELGISYKKKKIMTSMKENMMKISVTVVFRYLVGTHDHYNLVFAKLV